MSADIQWAYLRNHSAFIKKGINFPAVFNTVGTKLHLISRLT